MYYGVISMTGLAAICQAVFFCVWLTGKTLYYYFKVHPLNWQCVSSNFVISSISYSIPFPFLINFRINFINIFKNFSEILIAYELNQQIGLKRNDIFIILSLLIREHSVFLPYFRSFLISFLSVLWFLAYRCFTYFAKYVPKILTFLAPL